MAKKHPCPDCRMCQWCADSRCDLCGGWRVRRTRGRKGERPRSDAGAKR